jgi:glutaredoxin
MIVYSLPTCGQCKVLKKKLENKNISFTVVEDIEKMLELGIQGVPVLQLDDGTKLIQIDAIKWVDAQEEK